MLADPIGWESHDISFLECAAHSGAAAGRASGHGRRRGADRGARSRGCPEPQPLAWSIRRRWGRSATGYAASDQADTGNRFEHEPSSCSSTSCMMIFPGTSGLGRWGQHSEHCLTSAFDHLYRCASVPRNDAESYVRRSVLACDRSRYAIAHVAKHPLTIVAARDDGLLERKEGAIFGVDRNGRTCARCGTGCLLNNRRRPRHHGHHPQDDDHARDNPNGSRYGSYFRASHGIPFVACVAAADILKIRHTVLQAAIEHDCQSGRNSNESPSERN